MMDANGCEDVILTGSRPLRSRDRVDIMRIRGSEDTPKHPKC